MFGDIAEFIKKSSPSSSDQPTQQYQYQSADGKIQSNSADGAFAELTRADWDNFVEDDKPYIMDYANEITDDSYVTKAVNQAKTGVEQGYSLAAANNQNRISGMGIAQSDAQKANAERQLAIAKGASLADAQNSARDSALDRQMNLISGTNFGTGG